MIYSYNTLGWYSAKAQRQYDKTGNIRVLHHWPTNVIPAFQIVLDDTITTASYEVFDIDDNLISSGSVTVENASNTAGTAYSRLKFLGTTITSQEEGFYYLKITYDSSNYIWSDAFCWLDDVSELLKVSAVSSNIQIGEFEINLSGFTYEVYLDAKGIIPEYEITEEGDEKTYGVVPLFNSRNKLSEFQITGYWATLDFLAGLRILETNGTISITYLSDTFEVYNIENSEKVAEYSY